MIRPLLGLVAVLAAALVFGPRVDVDTSVPDPMVPGDAAQLDLWLATSEARVPGVQTPFIKEVIWADPSTRARTPLSVVYLHGFSATRLETAPFADSIAAALGANLFYTRLAGHGRDGAAMAEASVNAWLRDTREALAVGSLIGERVVVIGSSTGGTLALWGAADAPERDRIASLVLISPNLGPADPRSRIMTWPWGGVIARVSVGAERSWEPHNEAQGRAWTTRYPTSALGPMMALVDLVRDPARLARVDQPVLMLLSPDDEVIDVAAASEGFDRLASAQRRRIDVTDAGDPSNHVLAGEILSPTTTLPLARAVVDFVREVAPEAAPGVGPENGPTPGPTGSNPAAR